MKIGIGLPFKTSRDSWPAIEALARKADPGPYSSFVTIAFHRELGTDELILKPATLAPDQVDRLTEAVAKEL